MCRVHATAASHDRLGVSRRSHRAFAVGPHRHRSTADGGVAKRLDHAVGDIGGHVDEGVVFGDPDGTDHPSRHARLVGDRPDQVLGTEADAPSGADPQADPRALVARPAGAGAHRDAGSRSHRSARPGGAPALRRRTIVEQPRRRDVATLLDAGPAARILGERQRGHRDIERVELPGQ